MPPANNKKKGESRAKDPAAKKGGIVGFDEEEEDPNFDEFLADIDSKKK